MFTYQNVSKNLNLPLAIIATDLHTGEKVTFRTGDVAKQFVQVFPFLVFLSQKRTKDVFS